MSKTSYMPIGASLKVSRRNGTFIMSMISAISQMIVPTRSLWGLAFTIVYLSERQLSAKTSSKKTKTKKSLVCATSRPRGNELMKTHSRRGASIKIARIRNTLTSLVKMVSLGLEDHPLPS
jgi:hypothetical protein